MSRRRPRPDVAAASAFGFYRRLDPKVEHKRCSKCNMLNATVNDLDGLCIKCWMSNRAENRGDNVGK